MPVVARVTAVPSRRARPTSAQSIQVANGKPLAGMNVGKSKQVWLADQLHKSPSPAAGAGSVSPSHRPLR